MITKNNKNIMTIAWFQILYIAKGYQSNLGGGPTSFWYCTPLKQNDIFCAVFRVKTNVTYIKTKSQH